jgi:hypothetical protein
MSELPESISRIEERARCKPTGLLQPKYACGVKPSIPSGGSSRIRKIPPETSISVHSENNRLYASPKRRQTTREDSETTKAPTEESWADRPEANGGSVVTETNIQYEANVTARLASARDETACNESQWKKFMEWGQRYVLSPISPGQIHDVIAYTLEVDIWMHMEETYKIQRGSMEEVLGNYNWCFLISTDIDRLIYDLDLEDLNLYICGYGQSTAYETAETYWGRKINLQPLILATSANRIKYEEGWRLAPKERFAEGGLRSRDYA